MWSSLLLTLPAIVGVLISAAHGASHHTPRQSYGEHNFTASGDGVRANFTLDELWKLQVRFWDNFVNNSTEQSASINSTLLAPDCLGRVDVSRTFDGQELNTEYLFGLFANLKNHSGVTILGQPVSYEIIHFAGTQDISSAATVVYFKNEFMGTFPVEIDSWITWNKDGQMYVPLHRDPHPLQQAHLSRSWQYDATYRWFANLLDATVAAAGPIFNTTSPSATLSLLTTALATSICTTTQQHCTGANTQYADFDACFRTLTADKRFGASYELGGDTLLCRMVHENMVPLRPDVHCPHVGPDGGGMCVDDVGYAERVTQPYFTRAPMVPEGYESGDAGVAAW
ncbi:secreted protein [Neofusicoccum parvum]|uniref:Secreted protein n=1 Tax=Neofusicoccum parvum TaxID=310453 RepID=A0ACB5SRY9_9PEZI|nr:secreted protein [Neofusicoccum parvum]